MRILALLALMFPLICQAANTEYFKIYMLQLRDLILEKIGNVEEMDRYIKDVEKSINQKISTMKQLPAWGFLVMAVREDGKIKAWVDTDDEITEDIQKAMRDTAQNTPAFAVNQGAVIFALGFGVNGGELPMNKVPFPNEWKNSAACTNEDCAEKSAEKIVLETW